MKKVIWRRGCKGPASPCLLPDIFGREWGDQWAGGGDGDGWLGDISEE
jgi:hypothetical protein